MSNLWKPWVESISDDHLKCPLILFLPRVPSHSVPLPLLESQPGSFTSRSGNGEEGSERGSGDSRFVVGLYGAILPGARARLRAAGAG